MHIVIPKINDVKKCANVYRKTYQEEPWSELYEISEVETYLGNYLNSDTKCCFALVEKDEIKGVALGFIVPSIGGDYLRLEDFCIDASVQKKGYGSSFMNLLQQEAVKLGCDSILLGTQKDYPSYHFYLKNGFQEIESVLLYKEV